MEPHPHQHAAADNEALRRLLAERNDQLYQALYALAGMWNQYCPPPWTHQCMSAGQDDEEVLQAWGLLKPDETAYDLAYLTSVNTLVEEDVREELLEKVKALVATT